MTFHTINIVFLLLTIVAVSQGTDTIAQLAQQSIQEQRQIEADDVMSFEEFRQYYVSTERLTS